LLERQTVETGVAPDIQNCGPRQVFRNGRLDLHPLHSGIVAQEVFRGGEDTVQIQVVKPLTQFGDPPNQLRAISAVVWRVACSNLRFDCGHLLEPGSGLLSTNVEVELSRLEPAGGTWDVLRTVELLGTLQCCPRINIRLLRLSLESRITYRKKRGLRELLFGE